MYYTRSKTQLFSLFFNPLFNLKKQHPDRHYFGIKKGRIKPLLKAILSIFFFVGSCLSAYGETVDLTWNANLESDISGYKVYFGTNSRTYGTPVDVGNSTTYTLTGLSGGTYFFAVTAYDLSLNESPFSDEVSKVISISDTSPPVISEIGVTRITEKGTTISWDTDELASTQVEYGTSASYGLTSALDISMSTTHTQALANLLPATTYHYRLLSRDMAGNLATSGDNTFTTTALPQAGENEDVILSEIEAETVTSTSAIISWKTNMLASTQIFYGTTTDLTSRTNLDTTLLSNHRQQLKGLLPDALYYFQVVSTDTNGSTFSSETFNFKTGEDDPVAAPPENIVNFSATGGNKLVLLTWLTPLDTDFVGVRIRFRTDRFPTDINDGTLLGDMSGPMDEQMGTTHRNLKNGLTYYYLAASYNDSGQFQTTAFVAATPSGFVFDAEDTDSPGSGCGMIFRNGGKPPGPGDAAGMILVTGIILLLFLKRRWRSFPRVSAAGI